MFSVTTIWALTVRYLILYTRSYVRCVEVVFWPVMDLLVWGYLTQFLKRQAGGDFPEFIAYLIGAMIFWDILFRAQQGMAMSFLEDVWTRNLLNVFVAPVRIFEFIAATCVVGLIRILVIVVLLSVTAQLLYSFNLLDFKWSLLPFVLNLLVFGWSLGMVSTALIVRWGQAAEALAWAVPFFVQPFVGVFYPISELPEWLQYIALLIPCSHVFEGMREVLAGEGLSVYRLSMACGLNVVFLAIGTGIFYSMLTRARKLGLLTKIATQ